jgi:predicted DNA-binding transcriptional regulator AlpA
MSTNSKPAQRRRKVSLPPEQREVWSAKDIMLRWNISAPTFWRYRKNGHVPPPDRKIGMHHAWSRDSVLAIERQVETA